MDGIDLLLRENGGVLPRLFLRRYIEFSRLHITPTISQVAKEILIDSYVNMRNSGGSKTITATPRQLGFVFFCCFSLFSI